MYISAVLCRTQFIEYHYASSVESSIRLPFLFPMAQQGASLISQIPPHERERFKQIVDRFRDRWQDEFSGELTVGPFKSCLPPANDPLFRAALIEIVAIDLVTRIDRKEPVSLLDYLALEIDLGPPEQLPVELLQVEFTHRLRSPNPIDAIDYAASYPAQSAELMQRIQSMGAQPQFGTMICSPVD
ncbi:MAG TPA: hypothetical protein VM260_06465, partial [Pirellula sp.]|nr:hypothetical protein [Pirellula sp.]